MTVNVETSGAKFVFFHYRFNDEEISVIVNISQLNTGAYRSLLARAHTRVLGQSGRHVPPGPIRAPERSSRLNLSMTLAPF